MEKEAPQELVVKGGVIVADEEELVGLVVLIDVARKQGYQLAVHLLHRWIGVYLLAGDATDGERLIQYLGLRVGAHLEVEALLLDAVDLDDAANLMYAVACWVCPRRLEVEK